MRFVALLCAVAMSCGPNSGPNSPVKLATLSAPSGPGGIVATGAIALDETHVYWTEVGSGGADGALFRVKKTGGDAEPLATGLTEPRQLAVNDTHVYWAERYVFRRVAKTGGTPEPANAAFSTTSLRHLVLDGEQLFVASSSRVMTFDLTVGTSSERELARGLNDVDGLVVTPTHVLWLEKDSMGNVSRRARDGSGVVELVVDDIPEGSSLVRDGETLWWAQKATSKRALVSAPLAGGPSMERAQFPNGAIAVAADGDVFVGIPYELHRVPRSGEPVLVAKTEFISAVVSDRQSVFFATEGSVATINRVTR